jgi:hypothetical protein
VLFELAHPTPDTRQPAPHGDDDPSDVSGVGSTESLETTRVPTVSGPTGLDMYGPVAQHDLWPLSYEEEPGG